MNFRILACIVLVSTYLSLSTVYAQESSTSTVQESSTSTVQESSTSTVQESSTSTVQESSTSTVQDSFSDKTPVTNKLYLYGGAYAHFDYSEDHTDAPLFVGVEVERSDQWLYGLGLFNNSFDQFSQYLYGGYKFKFKNTFKNFHAKITAGIIHGYVDEYQDKIPVNSENGYGLGIIPSVGWKKDKLGFDVVLLGGAGLLFSIGYDVFEF